MGHSAITPPAAEPIGLMVNGAAVCVAAPPATSLLLVLRNDLALNGPKYGCGLGECGACTVLIDGVAAPARTAPGRGAAAPRPS